MLTPAAKGAIDNNRLAVSLKRYPDTKPSFSAAAKTKKEFNTKINGERLATPWGLVVVLVIAFGNVQGAMPALLAGCDQRHQINDIE